MSVFLPCPFCGAKEGDHSPPGPFDAQEGEYPHDVYCWGCGAHSRAFPTPEEAQAAWNRRVPAVAHASDCAVHNEPALPNGPCDCAEDKS